MKTKNRKHDEIHRRYTGKNPVILPDTVGIPLPVLERTSLDKETNIFPNLFTAAIGRINPGIAPDDIGRLLKDLTLLLDNDDLGRAFFEKLSDRSGIKLIDFDNFNNNSFHVVTELTCENGDEEFRPDITLLINGMPLILLK
ncbi:hypothetical protein CKQ54_00010 [Rahnella variigena]|uniref:type I site-specific deoxyribonuclease n=1 Tax=Rahnella variigena TaxID=574964 RepID=A0ABX9PQV9_9GAMM|nr:hypothetical protein CKQ54_00010 [Rahnella variigena]